MLIIHTTEGCAANGYRLQVTHSGPYYYRPVNYEMPDGTLTRVNGYHDVHLRPAYGSNETIERRIGRMKDNPWTSPWVALDADYPLKEDKLHECTHEHVDGEILILPDSVDVVKLVECKVVVPESPNYYVVEVDKRNERLIDVPEDISPIGRFDTLNVEMLVGQNVRTVLFDDETDSNGQVIEKVVFSTATHRHLGIASALQQTLPDTDLFVGVGHVFQNHVLKTRLRYYYHRPYPGLEKYYYLRGICDKYFDGVISIYSDGFEDWLRLMTPKQSEFTEGWVNVSNIKVASVHPVLSMQSVDNVLDTYRDRYFVPNRDEANAASAAAYQQALLGEKALDINTLMYLQDFGKIGQLIKSYTDLIATGVNPKTVSGAFLASWYGVRLTVKDTKSIIRAAKQYFRHVKQAYDYSYGRKSVTVNGVDLKANVSVAYGQYDQRLLRLLSVLSALDVVPTPSRLWDMIAYSFIVDWFLPVSPLLESFDAMLRTVVTRQYRTCRSIEVVKELPATAFVTLPMGLKAQVMEPVKYTYYQRVYDWLPSLPLPWLSADEISASWSSTRLLVSTALMVQRI